MTTLTQTNRPALRNGRDGSPVRLKFPKSTLPQILEETARKFRRRTALIYFGRRLSYDQLLDHVNRCAAGLQALGVRKGERVALMMPNCPQFVVAYFGALKAGAIVTATSSMYTRREAAHQWHDAGVKALIVEQQLYPAIKAACSEAPSLRNIVVAGPREYFSKNLAALERTLLSSPKRKSSKSKSPQV